VRRRVLAVLLIALIGAPVALAAKIEVGASTPVLGMSGWSWIGRVRLGYAVSSTVRELANGPPQILDFRIANVCSRRGHVLHIGPLVRRNHRFSYHRGGLTLTGNVIGRLGSPREVAGFWTVATRGCHSGPWWFDAYP
jgi:hypothetical protein